MPLDGILVIDKPTGQTSHDVVQQVRRITRQRSVGHAGTLDPLATGVLVLGLGKATRLLEYLSGQDKAYDSTWQLGTTTTSDDADGQVLQTWSGEWPSQAQLRSALAQIAAQTSQLPPQVAAIKQDGQRQYDLVRAGVAVTVAPRSVTIRTLELLEYSPPLVRVHAEVSKGTYIRSLARDVGTELGTGAHVTQLRRTRSGVITLEHAVSADQLATANTTQIAAWLQPMGFGLELPRVELDDALWTRMRSGQRLGGDAFWSEQLQQGKTQLLGEHPHGIVILEYRTDYQVWQPKKVIAFTSPARP